MNDFVLALILLITVPGYLYLLVRWTVSAAVRSYFEVKHEFSKPK